MIVRLGFLVVASIAAYAVKQINVKPPLIKSPENVQSTSERGEEDEEQLTNTNYDSHREGEVFVTQQQQQNEEEEEKEEVKLMNDLINGADFEEDDDDILPEFESLLSGEIDLPLAADKYETEMSNVNANEVEKLRNLVKELEEREVKLEGELLEYYGLKEQESDVVELQRQVKMRTVEIEMLKVTINSLQAERKKLQEQVVEGDCYRKELEGARKKMKELQRQFQMEANQTKGQLLLLKQQVGILQTKEQDDTDIDKKLKALKDIEMEVVELKRKNRELQHEKRQLVVKLDAANSTVAALSNTTESEMVGRVREEVNKLKHTNEDLLKQVEGLQMNRFSEVEELVYLRWVNACLRFELRNYESPAGKTSARDLSKNLSPRSQEKAKQLMLEYAGSERGQGGDTDLDSNFSQPSSPGGSEDFDTASIDSSMSKYSSLSKRPSLIQKLKKWGGKTKDDVNFSSSPARSSFSAGGSPMTHKPRGPLEALMLRNAGESVAITTFGAAATAANDHQDSSMDLNNVASSFQLMSKSVEGVLDDKYPAYKDRHKLALEREKKIKEKADQARAVRFGDTSSYKPHKDNNNNNNSNNKPVVSLPPKLSQVKERVAISAAAAADVSASDGKATTVSKMQFAHIEKRPPRLPRPPPTPTGASPSTNANPSAGGGPPPPPLGGPSPPPPPGGPPRPPPPPGSLSRGGGGGGDKVHRAPELVEFYQSLMKREAKKDTSLISSSASNTADARSNMIGEIENRSTFLLAVKADVETQGDFVESLASEVRAASFTNIEDLVVFVNWLDEELSFLVDERAVLKHFDWPEGKADAFREATFEYQDLMKLEKQVSTFLDDPALPCEPALKKMYKLLEKVENSVYALLRTRDMAMSRYKEFGIPVNWLQDSGVVGKIKLSSVQLARKYMKRVASELDVLDGLEKEPNREFLVLQGVRFAFRVHQFAGGFDTESMKAFEELRSRMTSQPNEENKQGA